MVAALIDTLYLAGKEEKYFLIPVRMYPVPTSLTWIQAVQSHSGVSLEKKRVLIQQWQVGEPWKMFLEVVLFLLSLVHKAHFIFSITVIR